MEYSITQLSQLAGVSTRTLRHYDRIGLLKPSRVTPSGYRYYGHREVMLLQQILFYRHRGLELKIIKKSLYDEDFDMLKAMEDHLLALERQHCETEALIRTVKKTIRHMKGECEMADKEKFQALKEKLVHDNEKQYGEEVRRKYGEDQAAKANSKMMSLTQEQFEKMQELDEKILKLLEAGIQAGITADSAQAKEIAQLHRQWLSITVPKYSQSLHKGIAAIYIADERFTKYYDRNVDGCAQLLHDAVQYWI